MSRQKGTGGGLFSLSNRLKGDLIRKTREKKRESEKKETKPRHIERKQKAIPEAFTRFDRFPGYEEMLVPQTVSRKMGIANPFFRIHDGVANSTTEIGGKQYINYASYNYLGLSGDQRVNQASIEAIEHYGTSVSAARLGAGERPIQHEFEQRLAELYGVEDSLVFVSGHATNVTTIGYLFGEKDLIIHDSLIHNSVLQGAQLAGAHRRSFPHNDWQALDTILTEIRPQFERALIVIEGLYSMDGDFPELPQFVEIKRRHKAFLMVDEAHSLGVIGKTGRGLAEHFGMPGTDVDIWMGTLSKTLAGCGGYIAGNSALVEHLRYRAPGFLYSVGIPAPICAASNKALQIMLAEPDRVKMLQQRGQQFLELAKDKGINTGTSAGFAVIPVIVGSSLKAVKISNALFKRGLNVQPIIYPGVEEKAARLRFFICSSHTEEQITKTMDILVEVL